MPSPTQQTPEIATAKTGTAMPRAHGRRRLKVLLAVLGSTLAMLALAVAPQTSAGEPSGATTTAQSASSEPSATGIETTTPGTSTAPPPAVSSPTAPPSTNPATPPPTEAPGQAGPEASTGGPQVEAQHTQNATPGGAPAGKRGPHAQAHAQGEANAGEGSSQTTGGTSGAGVRAGHRAPRPSSLTPALPLALGGSIAGVPGFFIESFRIPPFLLPIYQAAGTAYGIPWQVLAAINEVETDYGRDLSVSSAGAEGWMQFLPSTWAQYGVDANGDGFKDPYNPADAIFAAARYLRAAGGDTNVRAAVYSYNHSQAYVDSVMLRAQLLGGTPPELLGAVTGLTEARFPVHAPSHFGDGFQTLPGHGSSPPRTLVGTTIYSQPGAPVIAVQDGEIVQIGDSSALGRFVSLRDAYGNTYVYARLGSVATLYPVLEPHDRTTVSARIAQPGAAAEPAPSGPATAGAQRRSPLSEAATESGLALGAAAGLEPSPTPPPTPTPAPTQTASPPASSAPASVREFRSGPNDVYLHPLRPGVQVIAGTVLGHIGTETGGTDETATSVTGQGSDPASGAQIDGGPHMFFQIRPAGLDAPLIDPKPILDGWVALENTSIFRAKGENPFLATSPSVGQVLLESKSQLEQQVVHDTSIRMPACERQDVQTGRIDKRVLATLELLSVSGLKPTVTGLKCVGTTPAVEGNASAGSDSDAVKITAVNGIPIAEHQGQGSIADTTIRKLLTLQGVNRPLRIVSLTSVPGAKIALAKQSARDYIYIAFSPPSGGSGAGDGGRGGGGAHAASVFGSALTANEWIKLIARLGEIPDPTVASGPSTAAIPDKPGAPAPGNGPTGSGPTGSDGLATPGAGDEGTSGAGRSGTGTSATGVSGVETSEGGSGGHG